MKKQSIIRIFHFLSLHKSIINKETRQLFEIFLVRFYFYELVAKTVLN
jgi:hypothetical protein